MRVRQIEVRCHFHYFSSRTRNGMEDTTEEEPFFVRELECDAKRLQIKQWCVGDVSCVVWDAALVLCKFLESPLYFPQGFWNGKRVVDLGSGTGVTGLAAAVLG